MVDDIIDINTTYFELPKDNNKLKSIVVFLRMIMIIVIIFQD